MTPLNKLLVGESTTFDNYTVKRVSGVDFILRDKRIPDRARWGTRSQIAEDLSKCMTYDILPGPDGIPW